MNDKEIMLEKGAEQQSASHVSHRRVYGTVFAAIVCILLALLVWVSVMNTQDTDYIPIRVEVPEGYACTLSVEGVTVQGTVMSLKKLDEIVVTFSAENVQEILYYYDGAVRVNGNILPLPADVSVSAEWEALLTVTEKK